jgi:hypothetical protein
MRGVRIVCKFKYVKLKERQELEGVGIPLRIIIKWIL